MIDEKRIAEIEARAKQVETPFCKEIDGERVEDFKVNDICYLLGEIESLQVQLDAAIAGQETLQKMLATHITGTNELKKRVARLNDQLEESRRRERAAVEDIEAMLNVDHDGEICFACCPGFDCGKERRCEPKWRGPREAGDPHER